MLKLFRNEFPSGQLKKKLVKDGELKRLDRELKELIKEKFSSKLTLYILDSGSCSGCELELQALFNPLYNISNTGIEVTYTIQDADILLISGLMTENMYVEAKMIYEQLKEPKRVITIGDCPLFQAPFKNSFALKNEGKNPFYSEYAILGCPPEPKTIMRELLKYLKKVG